MGIEDHIYNPSILRQKDGELRQPDYRVNYCPRGTEESGERERKRQAKTDRKGDVRVMVQMIKATAGKPSDLCLIPPGPTWCKERVNCHELSPALHKGAVACMCTYK